MADLKYYDVLLKPIVTEKSMAMQAEKKYTFSVNPDATKTQIKEAVEKMFKDVKVLKVNTMHLDGKLRRSAAPGEKDRRKDKDSFHYLLLLIHQSFHI